MGEKEKPWIRTGHGGSISGRFSKDQKLIEMTAMAIQMIIFDLVINLKL